MWRLGLAWMGRGVLPLMSLSFSTAQPACKAAWEPRSAAPWRPAPSTHTGDSLSGGVGHTSYCSYQVVHVPESRREASIVESAAAHLGVEVR